ncbi:hypothetical protein B0H13DRAFT_2656164 [Mycena leptocephala]|nr:hypothetical protein B0H13DRAFT_2656164 [Mycena leptocephala]
MVSAPLFYTLLGSFWLGSRAALVNRTIQDSSPVVDYGATCSPSRCDASTIAINAGQLTCDVPLGDSPTVTFVIGIGPSDCLITIPFIGIAVYAFLACPSGEAEKCTFGVDNDGGHADIRPTDNLTFGLSYFNASLPNGTHTLVITPFDSFELDYIIYTVDDEVKHEAPSATSRPTISTSSAISVTPSSSPTSGAPSSATSLAPSSSLSSPLSSPPSSPPSSYPSLSPTNLPVTPGTSKQGKPPIGTIVGAVLGGLVFILVSTTLVALFRCGNRRRQNTPREMLQVDTYQLPDVELVRVAVQQVLREQQTQRTGTGSLTGKRQQTLAVPGSLPVASGDLSLHADTELPAARQYALTEDMLLHGDSGLRLELARQVEELPPEYSP